MAEANEFSMLAMLLRYPENGYAPEAEHCRNFFSAEWPEAAALLHDFVEKTHAYSLEDLQAIYTATFDLNPVCSLEMGWHLFGENYERGEFLVKMRRELRRHSVVESNELPDHLTHALDLLNCMEPEEAAVFSTACLFTALDKMRAAIENKSNPFECILLAIVRLLELRYPRPEMDKPAAQPAFSILNSED